MLNLKQKFELVPWTVQQTFTGVCFTLVPFLLFAFAVSHLDAGPPLLKPLSPQIDGLNAVVGFVYACIAEGVFLLAPLYFARRTTPAGPGQRRAILDALGFRRFNGWRTLLWLVGLFMAILLLNLGYQDLITTFHLPLQTNDQVVLARGRLAPISTYVTLFAAVVIAPFCEEVFFRSFTFMGLRGGMPLGVALVLSSLIFAVAHSDPGSFVVLFFIGLALAFLRWHSRSIWPGLLLHMLNNGLSALSIILVLLGVLKP